MNALNKTKIFEFHEKKLFRMLQQSPVALFVNMWLRVKLRGILYPLDYVNVEIISSTNPYNPLYSVRFFAYLFIVIYKINTAKT